MYQYSCTMIENHDGDTSKIIADLGFGITMKMTVRWLGINAPELATVAGKASLAALNVELPPGTVCTITTVKDPASSKEKYGRYLGVFTLLDGTNVNDWMVAKGLAVPYDGHNKAAHA